MIKGHIYIFGDIYNEQGSWAQEMGVVSLKSVIDSLAANKDAEEIIVHIHSRGGEVNEG